MSAQNESNLTPRTAAEEIESLRDGSPEMAIFIDAYASGTFDREQLYELTPEQLRHMQEVVITLDGKIADSQLQHLGYLEILELVKKLSLLKVMLNLAIRMRAPDGQQNMVFPSPRIRRTLSYSRSQIGSTLDWPQ